MGDPYSLANRLFPIECPKCRKKFEEHLRRMDGRHELICPGCRFKFTANGSRLAETVTRALDDFAKDVRQTAAAQ